MITRRLVQVQIVVAVGLATVFLLPTSLKSGPAGIAVELPDHFGDWMGNDSPISEREHEVLAKDTQFARKLYFDLAGNEILVSIVMSGDDMITSIHRPERCLPAQGWNVVASERRVIPIENGNQVEATRLRNTRADDASQRSPVNLTYYWFVGYTEMTASHMMRTGIDMRDRVLRGYNQHWAYVTVTTNYSRRGTDADLEGEKRTSRLLEDFIKRLAPTLKRPDGAALFGSKQS